LQVYTCPATIIYITVYLAAIHIKPAASADTNARRATLHSRCGEDDMIAYFATTHLKLGLVFYQHAAPPHRLYIPFNYAVAHCKGTAFAGYYYTTPTVGYSGLIAYNRWYGRVFFRAASLHYKRCTLNNSYTTATR